MGDLQITYPATSIEIKRPDVLHTEAFAKQMSVLMSHKFNEAIPTTGKAEMVVRETRDVCDTRFISGWLPSILVTENSTQSFGDIPQISKIIRDSVVHANILFLSILLQCIVSVQVFDNALMPFRRSGMWTTAKVVLNISLVRDLDNIRGLFLFKIIIVRLMLKFLESPAFPAVESTGIEILKKVC
jgi:hypothetical protein